MVALALLVAAALLYGALGALSVVPLPASLASLARAQKNGRTKVIVSGYYITQNVTAQRGGTLPPYVFASGLQKDAPVIHVAPALSDVKAGRVAAVIDTSTSDGSQALPFAIHTIARWDSFVAAVIIGVLIAVAFAFWLAGTVVALVRRRV